MQSKHALGIFCPPHPPQPGGTSRALPARGLTVHRRGCYSGRFRPRPAARGTPAARGQRHLAAPGEAGRAAPSGLGPVAVAAG